ncbi:hypothetical protein Smic_24450 [Streptomyces microflavus]|uniref:Uncharacterized protein n=1 Tax=Streptomyces microflavus TaxID=1919 RepID=A0A7J0CN81_STRMI|nr:hypothetical protein Smic_24450 [Streptomyces microflavus]
MGRRARRADQWVGSLPFRSCGSTPVWAEASFSPLGRRDLPRRPVSRMSESPPRSSPRLVELSVVVPSREARFSSSAGFLRGRSGSGAYVSGWNER